MVRFLRRGHSLDKTGSQNNRHQQQYLDRSDSSASDAEEMHEPLGNGGGTPPLPNGRAAAGAPRSRLARDGPPSELDVMKEKFAKLLLGEDMSGTGKGVSSALALSNAITNLAASVFGEHRKLEPMAPDTKERWKREVGWLLSVTDHIVEFVPTRQTSENGTTMEIMSTAQRRDLQMNIPALRKLDAMLIGYMDNFVDQSEFWYEKGGDNKRDDDKWWMPTVKVPSEGLSDVTRKWLQYQKECVNQVLKAAMAINAQVLVEMEIPEIYIESLPKKGKTSLGDAIYRSITEETFDPLEFLEGMDLSTEHKVLDLKNRIEASTVIWKRKMQTKDTKSSWSSIISFEKREQFEERAETILHLLKLQFPGTPQSQLDISKIQYNRDVGYAILESYSRVLESLAYSVMSRIEDVLSADAAAQNLTATEAAARRLLAEADAPARKLDAKEELEKLNEAPASMTLFDFMGWHFDQDELMKRKEDGTLDADGEAKLLKKAPSLVPKKFSYVDSLSSGGMRSPSARH
ncbi:rho guanine nucleotide exchange factor 8-like [Phragmites australis]|uniref:rho guanine nucleotide exchange factor 8-like n=1 Tax=Phragmites australis TaxID=29695 RepID=UPI002D773BC6|nr:rho guanine nucleotide exchange factor 8-like [Phragmites australis]